MKFVYIGLPIAVLAGAAAAAPYVIGQQIEQRFRAAVADAEAQLGSPIEITRYDRGWLSSTAQTETKIGMGEGRTFDIFLNHDISHGPWPNLDFGRFVTTLQPPQSEKNTDLAKLFDALELKTTTELPLSGGYAITLDSAATEGTISDETGSVRIEWQGLHGTINGHGDNVIEAMDIQAPGLAFDVAADAPHDSGATMKINGITLTGSAGTDALGDDTPGYDHWNSHGELSVNEVGLGQHAGRDWAHFATTITVDSTTPGEDQLDYSVAYVLRDVLIEDPNGIDPESIRLDKAELAIGMNGLRASAIKTLVDALEHYEQRMDGSSARTSAAADEQRGRLILDALPSILADSPELVVEIPAIETDKGRIGASIKAALVPVSLGSSANALLAELIERASVDASAFADVSLVQWFAESSDNTQTTISMFNEMVDQGFLVVDGDQLKVHTTIDAKAISLNDKILPPELERSLRQGLMEGLAEGM